MKVIVTDMNGGRQMVVSFPDPEPGTSNLALTIRTENEESERTDKSLSYREVYVASRGGLTFRTH